MGFSRFLRSGLCWPKSERTEYRSRPVLEGIPSKSQAVPSISEVSPDSDSFETKTFIKSSKANHALIVVAKHTYERTILPYPLLKSNDEIIIYNYAVGLNPIDFKSVDYNFCLPSFPWVNGREMSGVIVAVGSDVKDYNVGDRVWTSTYYRDRRAGCFQQYVVVPQHTVSHIPANQTFDSAACLGVPALTAAMTLWKWLEVPMSKQDAPDRNEFLLVWGGSAVTGQFVIQIAARCGLQVIAVTSEKTRVLASTLGASHVVTRDGKSNDEIVAEIRVIAEDNITRAVDLVGHKTASCCIKALSTTKPGMFAPLAMMDNDQSIPSNISVKTVEMKTFVLNTESKKYSLEINRLISEGSIVMPDIEILKRGVHDIEIGLQRLKQGDMAGKKLVVRMGGEL